MGAGVIDPATGTAYRTHVRMNHCRGFSTCSDCSLLQAQSAVAKCLDEENKYVDLLSQHHKEVREDREEGARVARRCKIDSRHVGYMVDALDKHKMGIPTTESQAKCLAKLARITQKLTGAQSFKDDSVILFRTLPDVPTGGNLSMTIIAHLFTLPEVQQATDLYLNVDGASDNICYHVVYGCAHLLKSANEAAWPLQRIHLLRFKVRLGLRFRVSVMFVHYLRHILINHIHHHVCLTGGAHPQSTGWDIWAVVSQRVWQKCQRYYGT